jgi:hypothetical protein
VNSSAPVFQAVRTISPRHKPRKWEGLCAVIDPLHTAATALLGILPCYHKSPSLKKACEWNKETECVNTSSVPLCIPFSKGFSILKTCRSSLSLFAFSYLFFSFISYCIHFFLLLILQLFRSVFHCSCLSTYVLKTVGLFSPSLAGGMLMRTPVQLVKTRKTNVSRTSPSSRYWWKLQTTRLFHIPVCICPS